MNNEIVEQALRILAKSDQCSDEYDVAVFTLHHAIKASHGESLMQLVERGPVWDGDVISKSRRDDLLRWGLATRVCVKGEQGYTGANYRGWAVHRAGMKAGNMVNGCSTVAGASERPVGHKPNIAQLEGR